MNAHRFHPTLSRRNVVPFRFFFLLIVVFAFGLTAGVMQPSSAAGDGSGQGNQRPPFMSDEELKKQFNDDDLKTKDDKPAGKTLVNAYIAPNSSQVVEIKTLYPPGC